MSADVRDDYVAHLVRIVEAFCEMHDGERAERYAQYAVELMDARREELERVRVTLPVDPEVRDWAEGEVRGKVSESGADDDYTIHVGGGTDSSADEPGAPPLPEQALEHEPTFVPRWGGPR